jgi:hypothetical protein
MYESKSTYQKFHRSLQSSVILMTVTNGYMYIRKGCIYVYVYIHMYMYVYIYIHIYIHKQYIHIHIYKHTYISSYTYIHTLRKTAINRLIFLKKYDLYAKPTILAACTSLDNRFSSFFVF